MNTLADILAQYRLEGRTTFQGLDIAIENDRGSVRKGRDRVTGEEWRTEMKYPYGYIVGTHGMDADPVDCYIGPNKSAKFAFVIHQLKTEGHGFDEDKVMLGFDDALEAKEAYLMHYDDPKFYGTVSAVPMEDFKQRIKNKTLGSTKITASSLEASMALYVPRLGANGDQGICTLKVGDPVTVDGLMGRGVITKREGRILTVRFWSGEYVSRDQMFVHGFNENTFNKQWRDDNRHQLDAGGPGSGRHKGFNTKEFNRLYNIHNDIQDGEWTDRITSDSTKYSYIYAVQKGMLDKLAIGLTSFVAAHTTVDPDDANASVKNPHPEIDRLLRNGKSSMAAADALARKGEHQYATVEQDNALSHFHSALERLRPSEDMEAGGVGSGCNPEVGKCGRPPKVEYPEDLHKGDGPGYDSKDVEIAQKVIDQWKTDEKLPQESAEAQQISKSIEEAQKQIDKMKEEDDEAEMKPGPPPPGTSYYNPSKVYITDKAAYEQYMKDKYGVNLLSKLALPSKVWQQSIADFQTAKVNKSAVDKYKEKMANPSHGDSKLSPWKGQGLTALSGKAYTKQVGQAVKNWIAANGIDSLMSTKADQVSYGKNVPPDSPRTKFFMSLGFSLADASQLHFDISSWKGSSDDQTRDVAKELMSGDVKSRSAKLWYVEQQITQRYLESRMGGPGKVRLYRAIGGQQGKELLALSKDKSIGANSVYRVHMYAANSWTDDERFAAKGDFGQMYVSKRVPTDMIMTTWRNNYNFHAGFPSEHEYLAMTPAKGYNIKRSNAKPNGDAAFERAKKRFNKEEYYKGDKWGLKSVYD